MKGPFFIKMLPSLRSTLRDIMITISGEVFSALVGFFQMFENAMVKKHLLHRSLTDYYCLVLHISFSSGCTLIYFILCLACSSRDLLNKVNSIIHYLILYCLRLSLLFMGYVESKK